MAGDHSYERRLGTTFRVNNGKHNAETDIFSISLSRDVFTLFIQSGDLQ